MGTAKAISRYLAYAFATTILFVYLLFPGQIVTAYIGNQLAAIDPALGIQAKTVRLLPPLKLKMTSVDLHRDGVRLIHMDDVRIFPELGSLMGKDKRMRFTLSLADGAVQGQLAITPERVLGNAEIEGVDLEKIDFIKRMERFSLSGTVEGHLARSNQDAELTGRLSIPGLQIQLDTPFLDITDIVMEKTNAEFLLKNNTIQLTQLSFDGPMVEGRISGTIQMDPGVDGNALDLTGTVRPQPDLLARLQSVLPPDMIDARSLGARGLPFQLLGTFDQPDLSLK